MELKQQPGCGHKKKYIYIMAVSKSGIKVYYGKKKKRNKRHKLLITNPVR